MKLLLPVLAVAAGLSFNSHADQNVDPQVASKVAAEGWYLGVDITNSTVDAGGKSTDLDIGGAISLGYDFKVMPKFVTGLELEYILHGTNDIGDGWGTTNQGHIVQVNLEERLSAINVNIRPKYYIHDGFYVGGILGFGSVTYEQEATKSGFQSATLLDESDSVFNIGIDLGYQFDSGWLIRAGMRQTSPEFFNTKTDITTTSLGLGYKF